MNKTTSIIMLAVPALALGAVATSLVVERVVCAEEDSINCVWVGPVQGNGGGDIVINGEDSWINIQLPELEAFND